MEADPEFAEFVEALDKHARVYRVFRAVPSNPRCAVCRAPYGGVGGRVFRLLGFSPSRKNPRLCDRCFEKAPMGGEELDVGILFADVRGYTALTEQRPAREVSDLLQRFYATAVDILCRHAIIDKLVGDQVMALYLPGVFEGDPGAHMLADAQDLIAAATPWIEIGVGLDYGTAMVGNVGSGEVKDFTAIGDPVNTAARLQSVAQAGQIVFTPRVASDAPGAQRQTFELKGKSEPVEALVLTPTQSSRAAST